jgi:hypothetical protein
MRALILIAGAALALGGCGNNDQKDNSQNIDENLTAENIVSNDVTAIDAVTGDAANMAADVDMNYGNLGENGAEPTSNEPAATATPSPTKKSAPRPSRPAETNTTNTTSTAANAASNTQ